MTTKSGEHKSGGAAAAGDSSHDSSPCVVIAIDASKQASHAVQYYFDHIHRKENRLVLLHVLELPDIGHARQAHLTPSALYDMWMEENAKSKVLEEQYNQVLAGKQIHSVVYKTEKGMKPGEVIVQVAKDEKAELVVMGTRGLGMVRRTILGSASDYVVHHSHCAVLVCRHGDVE